MFMCMQLCLQVCLCIWRLEVNQEPSMVHFQIGSHEGLRLTDSASLVGCPGMLLSFPAQGLKAYRHAQICTGLGIKLMLM